MMSKTEANSGTQLTAIGSQLRRQRQRRGLSLESLSSLAGVSFGLISQLERGLGNPSYNALRSLTDALDISLSALLSETEPQQDAVVRVNERRLLPMLEEHPVSQRVVRELLTPTTQSSLQVIRSTLPAGFTNEGKAFRHLGTECVVVESGTLTVVHGTRRVDLVAGDSMTYLCSMPHWWANTTAEPCVVLGAVTPFE
jgi:transcriptional regulator with XRE-family HTH domain